MAVLHVLGAGSDWVSTRAFLAANLHQQATLYRWHRENVPNIVHGFSRVAGCRCRTVHCRAGANFFVCIRRVLFWSSWPFSTADWPVCSSNSGSAMLIAQSTPPSLQQTAGALCASGRGGVCLSARKTYQKWVGQRNAQIGEMGSILPNQI